MTDSKNGDLSLPASADTAKMPWTPSPSGSVWRKRVHLVGPPEAGQVTSVVRYEPDSRFPAHDHPEGEEILVLDGVFSDEHGDWPAGTYLLNPEGFRHAPFSERGCVLFVKLRQYAGRGREHIALRTHELAWTPAPGAGVDHKRLYENANFPDAMRLERWVPGARRRMPERAQGAEILVLEGALEGDAGCLDARSWLRVPIGDSLELATRAGCALYVKTGGLAALRARPSAQSTHGGSGEHANRRAGEQETGA